MVSEIVLIEYYYNEKMKECSILRYSNPKASIEGQGIMAPLSDVAFDSICRYLV